MPSIGPFVGARRHRNAFSPRSLPLAVWYEPGQGGLFQSNAGVTPAVANGDVVGYMPGLFGGTKHLTSILDDTTRPTLQGVGVKPHLLYDGSNDILRYVGGTGIGAYAAGASSWFMAIRGVSTAAGAVLANEGGSGASNPVYSLLAAGSAAGSTLAGFVRNDGATSLLANTQSLITAVFDGRDHVIGMIDNGTTVTPYIDGVVGTPFTYTARTGTFTIDRFAIGGMIRQNPSSWWAGRFYGGGVINRVLTAAEIANITAYLANLYTAPVTANGMVANRTQLPTAVATIAANATSKRTHYAHPDAAITAIQTVDTGWYISTSPANSDARTIKRYIEYPAGTFTQITWDSGSTSKTISAGATVVSDAVSIAIPAGAQFWERTVNLTASVTNFPVIGLPANATVLGVDDGNDATDKGNSGTISATADTNFFGASALLGTLAASGKRSFVIAGDSIAWGQGDVSSVGSKGGSGYLARMLDSSGYPYTKIAAQGYRADLWRSSSVRYSDFLSVIGYTDALVEMGVNDLSNGSTQAQLLFDLQFIYAQLKRTGATMKQMTLTPKSTSTDSWATTGNQTASATGNMAAITSMNDAIRAGPSTMVASIIDAADQAMPSRNANIWTAPGATTDGTHPTSAKVATMATALASSV